MSKLKQSNEILNWYAAPINSVLHKEYLVTENNYTNLFHVGIPTTKQKTCELHTVAL